MQAMRAPWYIPSSGYYPYFDDVYLGRELSRVIAGRGSENNVPSVVGCELINEARPTRRKMDHLSRFTIEVINPFAGKRVELGAVVFSGGLTCSSATTHAGCEHVP